MSSQPESPAQSGKKGSVSEGGMGHDGPGAVERAASPLNKTTVDDPVTGVTGDSWRRATEHERGGEVMFPRANPKKTRGRVKIDIDFIQDRFRRRTTFSKRKKYIIKKAKELHTLTGTQVLVLAFSETGKVHTWSTHMFEPLILGEDGKALIQSCLGSSRPTEPSESPAAEEPDVAFRLSETGGPQGRSEDASPAGTAVTTSTPVPMRNGPWYYPHHQLPMQLNVMPPGTLYPEPPVVSLRDLHMAKMALQQSGLYNQLYPMQTTAAALPGSSPMVSGQQQQQQQ